LIVAQYEVLGNCVKRYVRPGGTIERPALGPQTASRAQATIDRPYGTDVSFLPFPGTSYRATIKRPSGA